MSTGLSWNLVDVVDQLLAYHFMLNALRAGTIVAVVAGAIGYFMVLRRQSFVGHTLSVAGFPGAAAAAYLGVAAPLGYFGFCIGGALVIAALPGGGRADSGAGGYGSESALIGTVQGVLLATGLLFVSLYHGFLSGLSGLLFGSIVGITDGQVVTLLVAGAACLITLAVIWRPLLFASIDPAVARARGVPVRILSAVFLVLGVAAAGTSQVTGSLLVFALLVAPAATAARLTARPALGLLLSVVVAVVVVWVGEGIAFFSPYPIGFWVTTVAFGLFLLASAARSLADRRERLGRRGTWAGGPPPETAVTA